MSKISNNRENFRYILKFSAYFSICVGVGWTIGASSKRDLVQMLLAFMYGWGISTLSLIFLGLLCNRILNNVIRKKQLACESLQLVKPFGLKERKLKFEYEFADYLEANRVYLYRQLGYWLGMIVVVLFAICFGVLTYLKPSDITLWLLLAFFLAIPIYSHFSLVLRAKKLFRQQRQLHGLQEFELKKNQIISKNPVTQQTHKWLLRTEFNDKFLLLFNTPATFLILPRRIFSSDRQYQNWVIETRKLISDA